MREKNFLVARDLEEYNPIERYFSFSSEIMLHRCRLCLGMYWEKEKIPALNNSFVPVSENPHIYMSCFYYIGPSLQSLSSLQSLPMAKKAIGGIERR